MAAVAVSVVEVVRSASKEFDFQAANLPIADHYTVVNDGRVALLMRNPAASGGAVEVTVRTSAKVDGLDVAERTYDIPEGEDHLAGPFPVDIYGSMLYVEADVARLRMVAWRLGS